MSMLINPFILGGPSLPGPLALAKKSLLTDTTSDSTHTFTAVDLGAPYSDRYVVVEIAWRATANATLNSVTIGGVTATRACRSTAVATVGNSEIYYANVPSGTTGDIVLTFSGTVIRKMVQPYVFSGFTGSSPSATSATTGNTALTLSSSGPAVAFELWSLSTTSNTDWLQGPYSDAVNTNLGSGSTPLSGNFGSRIYTRAATINGSVVASSASNALAGIVWDVPGIIESICDIYDEFSDGTDQTTVTTSSLQIGTATPGRMVVVGFGWSAAASRTISSVTIGGVTATAVVSNITASGGVAIYKATGVSGTTAAVVITFSGTVTRCSGTIARTTPASSTELDTGNGSGTSNIQAVDVSCSPGGFIFMIGREGGSGSTVTVTYNGVDTLAMDHAITIETQQTRAGFVKTTESATTNDITFSSTIMNNKNVVAASWL